MSIRDPNWTESDAARVLASAAWRQPEATLSFRVEPALLIADNAGFLLADPGGAFRNAFVTVNLTAGNLYHFWAETAQNMPGTPNLEIYDGAGYRLQAIDADELQPGADDADTDSLILFAPEVSGTYYLNIRYGTWPFLSGFLLEGWEDLGADFANRLRPAPSSVTLSPGTLALAEGDAGSTRYSFTLTRNGDLSQSQSVGWFVAGSGENPADAADFADPAALSGRVTFAAGQASATITIDVRGDTQIEQAESFELRLHAPSPGLGIGSGSATGIIATDDTGYRLTLSDTTVVERTDGSAALMITVTRSEGLDSVWRGSWSVGAAESGASAGAADFTGGVLPSGRIVLREGQASAFFFVPIAADTLEEGRESFTISLWSGEEQQPDQLVARATASILDAPPPGGGGGGGPAWRMWIDATSLEAREGTGAAGSFTFTLRADLQGEESFSARWLVRPASAESGASATVDAADFAAGELPGGFVRFSADSEAFTITVTFAGDGVEEANEAFRILLDPVFANATPASLTATLRDDDANVISITAPPGPVAEGSGTGTTLTFRVDRVSATTEQVVDWVASGMTAADFASGHVPSGRLTFGLGQTSKTIALELRGDAVVETTESLTITLSAPFGGVDFANRSATVAVTDDDALLSLAGDARLTEGDAGTRLLSFTLTRAGNLDQAASVQWRVAGDAALTAPVDGADFVVGVLPSGTASFAAGAASTTVTLQIAGDTRFEPDEQLLLRLFNPSPGLGLGIDTAQAIIVNDDTQVSLTTTPLHVAEGHAGTTDFAFTVTREGALDRVQGITWATVTTSGQSRPSDFVGGVMPGGSLTFGIGEASKTILIPVAGDIFLEPDEDFWVQLSAPTNGLTLGNARASARILSDDSRIGFTGVPLSVAEGQAGATRLTFTLAREGALGLSQTVDWVLEGAGLNRADAADFLGGVLPSGRVTFAPGEATATIGIDIAGDLAVEAEEGFQLLLRNPGSGVVLGTASVQGSILNDDARLRVTALEAAKAEGASGFTPFTFQITRDASTPQTQSVEWSVFAPGGRGQAGASDFRDSVLPAGRVEFLPGELAKLVTVELRGDAAVEPAESFALRLANPTGGLSIGAGSAGATILNDDSQVALTPRAATRAEGGIGATTNFLFDMTRSGVLAEGQSVDWAVVAGGDAPRANALDFIGGALPSGRITFAEGQASALISVPVAGDALAEGQEQFLVRLFTPSAGLSLGTREARGTILNDDTSVSIAAPSGPLAEGDSGSTAFTFTLSRTGRLDAAQEVSWSVSGIGSPRANAQDFAGGVLPAGRIAFAPGQASAELSVLVAGDTALEGAEQFLVRLFAPSAGLRVEVPRAIATIANDDPPALPLAASIWDI